MTEFDKKIKEMAAKEKMKVPEGYDDRIDGLIEQAVSKSSKAASRRRFYRFSTVAAVAVCSLVVALGVYAAMNWALYDWEGNRIEIKREVSDENDEETSFTSPDEGTYDQRLPDDFNPKVEVARLNSPKSGLWNLTDPVKINTESEFIELLQNAKQQFRIPAELPEGYHFKEAELQFYLSEDYISINMEPTRTVTLENGDVVELFRMPEEYQQHIRQVWIIYQNENGDLLSFRAGMCMGEISYFGATEQAKTSIPEIDGYEKVIYFDDVPSDIEYENRLYLWNSMDEITFFSELDLDYPNSMLGREGYELKRDVYDAMDYEIESNVLEEEELVNIARELKNVEKQ